MPGINSIILIDAKPETTVIRKSGINGHTYEINIELKPCLLIHLDIFLPYLFSVYDVMNLVLENLFVSKYNAIDPIDDPTQDIKNPCHIPSTNEFAITIAKSGNTGKKVSSITDKNAINIAKNL